MNKKLRRQFAVWAAMAITILPAGAVVSQFPLTGSAVPVPPNIMFTFDDSGSMDYDCLPDAMCTPNFLYVGTVPVSGSNLHKGGARYDSLLGMKLRSSANPIYYNPAIRYQPWLKSDGTRYPEYPARAAPLEPRDPAVQTINLVDLQAFKGFWCTTLENDSCSPFPETAVAAQYARLLPNRSGESRSDYQIIVLQEDRDYPKGGARTDCAADTICTGKEELQNFANWFSYSRNRRLLAIGGTSEAFADVPSTFRVGYASINFDPTKLDPTSADPTKTETTIRQEVRPFSGADREEFYRRLQSAVSKGGTPLRRAMDHVGKYFSRSDRNSPWADDPVKGQDPEKQLSCRRAFHILMTDGQWNDAPADTLGATRDVDNQPGPLITSADKATQWHYEPNPPFASAGGGTLADVAMFYWNRDLRPDLPNNVRPTAQDPAFWQHMVNYTIAFGVNGYLKNPQDLDALTAGTKAWGQPREAGATQNVDDLWHAALNSHGLSKSAISLDEYRSALKSIIEDIKGRDASEAGVAASSTSYSTSAKKFVPSYQSGTWSGDVEALALGDSKRAWLASEKLPAPADRNIVTFDGKTGIPFELKALDQAMLTSVLGVPKPGDLVDYLRGDRSNEGKGFRTRATPLGDIVNSSPVFVKDLVDSQYDFLAAGAPGRASYYAFRGRKALRTPQLFVGANDGMLHAFNAGDGDAQGRESFAFMPRAVLDKVSRLADINYEHTFYVDGALAEVDVFDAGSSAWRNLVVGGGGAGARNLFAINVPVPAASDAANPTPLTDAQSAPGARDVMWEVSIATPGFGHLGNVLRSPRAGLLKDGRWAVVSGNGYDSASGRAVLYLIDAIAGSVIKAIETGVGSPLAPNGLGGVEVVRDGNRRIVAAYAGDLRGNMWKFDLSSDDSNNWVVAFGGKPLFTATNSKGDPEPITAAPAFAPHPLGGVMVLAGSGKLFEKGDDTSEDERSLYGVWDKVPVGAKSDAKDATVKSNDDALVTQVLALADGTSGFIKVTDNPVDFGGAASSAKRGWRLRLTITPGQRLIYDAKVRSGRVIFETMAPGGKGGACDTDGPAGAILVLDPFSGSAGRDGPTFDTNRDRAFDAEDTPSVVGVLTQTIGTSGVTQKSDSVIQFLRSDKSSDSKSKEPIEAKLGTERNKRQWRQIQTPPKY